MNNERLTKVKLTYKQIQLIECCCRNLKNKTFFWTPAIYCCIDGEYYVIKDNEDNILINDAFEKTITNFLNLELVEYKTKLADILKKIGHNTLSTDIIKDIENLYEKIIKSDDTKN